MLTAILVSVAVVFVAELGDKSQLITMTYALRHRWWVVLSGVAIASMLVHGLSVAIGHFLGMTLPERPIAFAASLAFLLFAWWTWRSRGEDGEDDVRVAEPRFVVFAIVSSFVLAELGDKTMLATVALASDHHWAGVWIGATIGMVLADGVAIAVGVLMHKRLPERFLHGLASVLFLLFGLFLFFNGGLGLPWVAVAVTGAVAALAASLALVQWGRRRRRADRSAEQETSVEAPGHATGY
ncbi:TMEM165/GDT1 family protein [Mycolicibacterium hippocampi]|jgi:putative Ca2+/H+ antiporter (TMEM165/GDT1 family)|uniref:GDT1 family protein n=1 Tax=Mycolicibacterium hippocampi TaxID=659824 RepID=A0A850PUX6_9MYCO|nr:TMEM165/GDT1 family protein [Mycolicibacterium hippocampi]NVN51366.1 Conserved transmembrane protein [Mycolicibacterium hippocampi]